MMKYIFRDYIEAYRISRVKEYLKIEPNAVTAFWLVFYFGFILFKGVTDTHKGEESDPAAFLSVYLPMLLVYFSVELHPVRLSKWMYLCPMDKTERRQYIYKSYFFRIGLHMLLFVMGNCVLFFVFPCHIVCVMEMLLNSFVLAVMLPSNANSRENTYRIVLIVMVIILDMMQMFYLDQAFLWKQVFFLLGVAFVELPIMYRYSKFIRKHLQGAIMYEVEEYE